MKFLIGTTLVLMGATVVAMQPNPKISTQQPLHPLISIITGTTWTPGLSTGTLFDAFATSTTTQATKVTTRPGSQQGNTIVIEEGRTTRTTTKPPTTAKADEYAPIHGLCIGSTLSRFRARESDRYLSPEICARTCSFQNLGSTRRICTAFSFSTMAGYNYCDLYESCVMVKEFPNSNTKCWKLV